VEGKILDIEGFYLLRYYAMYSLKVNDVSEEHTSPNFNVEYSSKCPLTFNGLHRVVALKTTLPNYRCENLNSCNLDIISSA
jgi:hypothetical protein